MSRREIPQVEHTRTCSWTAAQRVKSQRLPDACSSHQLNCISPAASPLGRVSGGSPTSTDDDLWRASVLAEQGGLRWGPSRDRSGGVFSTLTCPCSVLEQRGKAYGSWPGASGRMHFSFLIGG